MLGGPRGLRAFVLAGFLCCMPVSAGLAATSRPDAATARPPASAPDLTDELNTLRDRWLKALGKGHSAAVQSPFVVIVDRDEATARAWLRDTVLGSTTRLQRQYMNAVPDRAMAILLFSGQEHYREVCAKLLGEKNPPHYGFFRPVERLLVMDIDTGGGTLVHELTHAMIAFDFPSIPPWFNEGLGSLYEQCRYEADRVVGLPNWRLPALQKAISGDTLGTIEELPSIDFRGANMGLNYAHARYLCFYMQDKGILEKFYRRFRDTAADDPTGIKALREAFAPKSLADVDKEWRKWVMTLRFPGR